MSNVAGTVQIAHDGFSRTFTYRRRIDFKATCAFCGEPARFQYQTVSEARPIVNWPNTRVAFCGIDCHRSYSY